MAKRSLEEVLDSLTRAVDKMASPAGVMDRLERSIEALTRKLDRPAASAAARQAPSGGLRDNPLLDEVLGGIKESLAAKARPESTAPPPVKDEPIDVAFEPSGKETPKGLLTYLGGKLDNLAAAVEKSHVPQPTGSAESAPASTAPPGLTPGLLSHLGLVVASLAGAGGRGGGNLPPAIPPPVPPGSPGGPSGEPGSDKGPDRRSLWDKLIAAINRLTGKLGTGLGIWSNPKEIIRQGERLRDQGGDRENEGRWKAATGRFAQGLKHPSELQGMGNMLSAAGDMAGMMGPGGKVFDALTKFTDKMFQGVDKLRAWNERLKEADFRFAEWSGSMAQVQAEHEMRMIQLSQERGERRSGAARFRQEQADELERTLAPIEDLGARIRDRFAGFGSWVSTQLLTPLSKIADGINDLTGAGPDEDTKPIWDLGVWTNNIEAERQWWADQGRPPQLGGSSSGSGGQKVAEGLGGLGGVGGGVAAGIVRRRGI